MLSEETQRHLDSLIRADRIVLFMKGTRNRRFRDEQSGL